MGRCQGGNLQFPQRKPAGGRALGGREQTDPLPGVPARVLSHAHFAPHQNKSGDLLPDLLTQHPLAHPVCGAGGIFSIRASFRHSLRRRVGQGSAKQGTRRKGAAGRTSPGAPRWRTSVVHAGGCGWACG